MTGLILKAKKGIIKDKVIVPILGNNGKTETKVEFEIECKTYKTSEITEILQKMGEGQDALEFVGDHLVGWSGLNDSNGEEVGFTVENLESVMDYPEYSDALLEKVKELSLGKRIARELKNL